MSTKTAQEEEASMWGLIKLVFKNFTSNFFKKLFKSLGIAILIFIVNTVVMILWGRSANPYLSAMIMRPGNLLSGTALWSLLGMNLVNLAGKFTGWQLGQIFRQLRRVGSSVLLFKKNHAQKKYFWGVIIALLIALLIGNPMLTAVTAFSFLMSAVRRSRSKLFYILRILAAKRDKEEQVDQKERMKKLGTLVHGMTLGLTFYTLAAGVSQQRLASSILIVIAVIMLRKAGDDEVNKEVAEA